MVTHTTKHQCSDRARLTAPSLVAADPMGGNWRLGAAVPATGGTTGLFADMCSTYVTGTNHTAGAFEPTIERPARHLGTRST